MPTTSTKRQGRDDGGTTHRRQTRRGAEAQGLVNERSQVVEVASRLAAQPIVAFDTEFVREKTFFPQLGLIQVADQEEAWLIDPLALSVADLGPLLDVFTDPKVLKVAHAIEQDQECLYHHSGVVASPVLDTTIAAGLTGLGEQISLAALLQKLLRVRLAKGHTRTDWLQRPLPAAMADYARADVTHLVAAAEKLLGDLERRGRREWALDLSAAYAEPQRYEINVDAVAERLAAGSRLDELEYAVLRSLVEWREKWVREVDRPRRWLADDKVLVGLARARPARRQDLKQFRGLSIKPDSPRADDLVQAIRRGLETPPEDRAPPPKNLRPEPAEAPALNLLKCFVNQLASEHEVAVRYLVDPEALLLVLRGNFKAIEELQDSSLLSNGTVELLGEQITEFLNGRIGLKLSGGQAVQVSTAAESSAPK